MLLENNEAQRQQCQHRVEEVDREREDFLVRQEQNISKIAAKFADERNQLEIKMQAGMAQVQAENNQLKECNQILKADMERRLT